MQGAGKPQTRPPRAPNGPLAPAAAPAREAQGPTAPRAIATRSDAFYSAISRWTGPSCHAQPLALPADGLLKVSEAMPKSEGCVCKYLNIHYRARGTGCGSTAAEDAAAACTAETSDGGGGSAGGAGRTRTLQAGAGWRESLDRGGGIRRAWLEPLRDKLSAGSGDGWSWWRRASRLEAARRAPTGGGRVACGMDFGGRAGGGTRAALAARGEGGGLAARRYAAAVAARPRGCVEVPWVF